jgi:tetratricopeptide (TPR) repeat protein
LRTKTASCSRWRTWFSTTAIGLSLVERLIHSEPRNALYSYWLSRIDYDRRFYAQGVWAGKKAIALSPGFLRAYDSIGLCDEALGRYQDTLQAYTEAARLNLQAVPPSPWPPLDLGALLLRLNRVPEAKKLLGKLSRLTRGSLRLTTGWGWYLTARETARTQKLNSNKRPR